MLDHAQELLFRGCILDLLLSAALLDNELVES